MIKGGKNKMGRVKNMPKKEKTRRENPRKNCKTQK
jgi:hypothetical protein